MNDKTKKYLDRVVNKLVDETTIDGYVVSPSFPSPRVLPYFYTSSFSEFVIEVYGLTEEEVDYVWKQYRNIIKDKINER